MTQQVPIMLEGLGGVGLTYDRENGDFTFLGQADSRVTTRDLIADSRLFVSRRLATREIPLEDIECGVVLVGDTVLSTPRLYSVLSNQSQATIALNEARLAIADTYAMLTAETVDDDPSASHMHPSAGLIRPGHPQLVTVGSCACVGVIPDGGLVDEYDFDSGYAEYAFHNIMRPEQMISLFAGLGTLSILSELG